LTAIRGKRAEGERAENGGKCELHKCPFMIDIRAKPDNPLSNGSLFHGPGISRFSRETPQQKVTKKPLHNIDFVESLLKNHTSRHPHETEK
jgi:hypothetical protein